jgi:hypothetical protein
MRSGGEPPLVQLETVLKHLGEIVHLGRPEIPPWVTTTDLTFGQLRLLFRLRHHGPTSMKKSAAAPIPIGRSTCGSERLVVNRPGFRGDPDDWFQAASIGSAC